MIDTRSRKRKVIEEEEEEVEYSLDSESSESSNNSELEEIFETIYDGSFFENTIIQETEKSMNSLSPEKKEKYIQVLKRIRDSYSLKEFDIVKILESEMSPKSKESLLESVCSIMYAEPFTNEYDQLVDTAKYYLLDPKKQKTEKITLKTIIMSLDKKNVNKAECFEVIDTLDTNNTNKEIIRRKMSNFFSNCSSDEGQKYKTWLQTVFSIPFGVYKESSNSIEKLAEVLDNDILYLDTVKDNIMCIPNLNSGGSLALYGEKGTGKSTMVHSIAKALSRPYKMISLGGESDASNLLGHGFTYVGSKSGKIVESLIESKCMNPVILVDELDKISDTHHGREIIGALMHIIDQTTNGNYTGDKYLGLTLDISKVTFVFTFNDITLVDKILGDRIQKIHVPDYTTLEKVSIITKKILPMMEPKLPIEFTEDALKELISKGDTGLRTIKQFLYTITTRVNLLLNIKNTEYIKLGYKKHQKDILSQFNTDKKIVITTTLATSLLEGYSNTEENIPFGMYI
jgi:ATP-dependent Lon protease